MDAVSNITRFLIEVCSVANEVGLPEKSNLSLTGNTEDREEVGKQPQGCL